MRRRPTRTGIINLVGAGVALVGLTMLLLRLAPAWPDALAAARMVGVGTIGVVIVSITAAETAFALIWARNTRALGSSLRYRDGWTAYFYSGLSRFLPGAVLPYVARVGLVVGRGLPAVPASIAMGMETMLSAMAALTLAFIGLGGRLVETEALRRTSVLLIVLVVGFIGVAAYLLLPWFLRTFGRTETDIHIRLRPVLVSLLQYSAAWLLLGAGVSALIAAMTTQAISPVDASGALALAWFAGLVAVPVPGGLGVREAVMAGVLADVAGLEVGILVALIHRIAWSLVIAFAGIGALSVHHSSRGQERGSIDRRTPYR